MKKLYFWYLFMITFLFSGCTLSTYSIKPHFDVANESLKIDSLELKIAQETLNKSPMNSQHPTTFKEEAKTYFFKENLCEKITYYSIETMGKGYITDNADDNIKQQFLNNKNGSCDVVEINNLKFFKCRMKINVFAQVGDRYTPYAYFITASTSSSYGYKDVYIMTVDNNRCYEKFINHFKEKALVDKTLVKKYSLEGNNKAN